MIVGSKLHAGEIDCLVSRLVNRVRWLGVFASDKLPDVTCEIRPWCLILNTDPKNQPGTHWLACYAPLVSGIELFDSFGFSPSMYNLEFFDPLHSSYCLQSPSTSVCGHYCIVYIYLRSPNYSFSDIVYLLLIFHVVIYGSTSIFTVCKFVFAFSIHVTELVNVANYNVNFVKQIKM